MHHPLSNQYIWHIDEGHLPHLRSRLQQPGAALQPKLPAYYEKQIRSEGLTKAWNRYFTETYSTDARVLVLPVQGEMTRYSYWGFGNEFLARQLHAARQDDSHLGCVLAINTPGGTCDSTPALAEAVAEFRQEKPIVTATAYCCSAGYFVASQCDEIVMEDQAASLIGSIGTLLIYENWAKALEQQGIHMEIMRATKSQNKARVNWIEELPDEARAELQATLDDCQREFEGYVKRGRAGKLKSEEVMTGLTYGTADALRLGLADRKGDLATAVKRVLQLNQSK